VSSMQIPLQPVDSVAITILMDNVADALIADSGPAHRQPPARSAIVPARFLEGGSGGDALKAEHGFSALLTVRRGERSHTVLFDTGVSPDGMVENARRLETPLKDIEAVVLSHGHFDHTTGLDGLATALGGSGLPLILHPLFWTRRRLAIPGREPREIRSTSKTALRGAGFEVIEEQQPSFLLDNSLLITGEVDRTTPFEQGFPVHEAFQDGAWQPDPLILDDQAAVLNVAGKGLVVLTGCGHAGIVNIVRYAQKLTGIDQVYAVLGGFHLTGPWFEPIMGDTAAALAAIGPSVIVPAHCTGWKAQHLLAATLPDAFIQNSVGTRYDL
jgi:7,8-dihydropterin-6-yl-methyl-4-(beta-D-ribofuranosyl)aminobenzene 5'-phosphate synthase